MKSSITHDFNLSKKHTLLYTSTEGELVLRSIKKFNEIMYMHVSLVFYSMQHLSIHQPQLNNRTLPAGCGCRVCLQSALYSTCTFVMETVEEEERVDEGIGVVTATSISWLGKVSSVGVTNKSSEP